jgi:hypothetical protein
MSAITLRRSLGAILIAFVALFSSDTLAQERHNPARECIEHIEAVTQRTVHSMHTIADRRVEIIQALDANGAEESVLRESARTGREHVSTRAQSGADRIQSLVQRCVETLMADNAPLPVIMSVVQAGQDGRERIIQGAENSIERINRNLYIALNN